jgi:hypothetical protein
VTHQYLHPISRRNRRTFLLVVNESTQSSWGLSSTIGSMIGGGGGGATASGSVFPFLDFFSCSQKQSV